MPARLADGSRLGSTAVAKPVGPYTPAVRAGDWLICSGQVGVADGALVEGGMASELQQAFTNLRSLLGDNGATLDDVVKTTVFLTDMGRLCGHERGIRDRVRRPPAGPFCGRRGGFAGGRELRTRSLGLAWGRLKPWPEQS